MVTPKRLAELIEDDDVLEATEITDTEQTCPECGGSVIEVGYMPDATAFRTGRKCQDCEWATVTEE
jgi:hypothetical protein